MSTNGKALAYHKLIALTDLNASIVYSLESPNKYIVPLALVW